MNKNYLFLLAAFFLFILLILPKNNLPKKDKLTKIITPTTINTTNREKAKVKSVIDGDTILLEDNRKIRYIGINTPETKHPNKKLECFGKEAYLKNIELVEGKEVYLEKDISNTDRYGRLLRYVYINNLFVNDYLVKEGFASISTFPPDVKFKDLFLNSQNEARNNNKGLWNKNICP